MSNALNIKFLGATNNAFKKSLSLTSVIETMQERYSNEEIMVELANMDQSTQSILQAQSPTEEEKERLAFSEWFQSEFLNAFKLLEE